MISHAVDGVKQVATTRVLLTGAECVPQAVIPSRPQEWRNAKNSDAYVKNVEQAPQPDIIGK